jgi:hypothetical protein
MIHLIDCTPVQGRPARSKPARVHDLAFRAGVTFRRNTHALARGLAVLNAGHMPP